MTATIHSFPSRQDRVPARRANEVAGSRWSVEDRAFEAHAAADTGAPRLTRHHYLTAAGEINRQAVIEVATRRAHSEMMNCARIGWIHPFSEVYEAVLELEEDTANALRNALLARAERMSLTPQERVIRDIELRIHILPNGLAMPYDAGAIAHHERLLAEAKAAGPGDFVMLPATCGND